MMRRSVASGSGCLQTRCSYVGRDAALRYLSCPPLVKTLSHLWRCWARGVGTASQALCTSACEWTLRAEMAQSSRRTEQEIVQLLHDARSCPLEVPGVSQFENRLSMHKAWMRAATEVSLRVSCARVLVQPSDSSTEAESLLRAWMVTSFKSRVRPHQPTIWERRCNLLACQFRARSNAHMRSHSAVPSAGASCQALDGESKPPRDLVARLHEEGARALVAVDAGVLASLQAVLADADAWLVRCHRAVMSEHPRPGAVNAADALKLLSASVEAALANHPATSGGTHARPARV